MAVNVAQWVDLYKIDGIDLDIEAGAGDKQVKVFSWRTTSHKGHIEFCLPGSRLMGCGLP